MARTQWTHRLDRGCSCVGSVNIEHSRDVYCTVGSNLRHWLTGHTTRVTVLYSQVPTARALPRCPRSADGASRACFNSSWTEASVGGRPILSSGGSQKVAQRRERVSLGGRSGLSASRKRVDPSKPPGSRFGLWFAVPRCWHLTFGVTGPNVEQLTFLFFFFFL